jgi:S-adenosylmethionine hydrolase
MLRGPITLTTDFGTRDHFVGTMKGVILGIAPRVQIVDITHEIEPYNIREGAYEIAQAWRYFPKGTIHVVVVDPRVGSARRAIVCEAEGQFFVAPDNGVLSMIYDSSKHKVQELANRKMFLKEVSRTFHGRDVFAPVAGHLACGVSAARFGGVVRDYVVLPGSAGVVLKVDRFGNLITNFRGEFRELLVGGKRVRRVVSTFSEGAVGELVAIVGSSGFIEIVVNQGSAAGVLGVGSGAVVEKI